MSLDWVRSTTDPSPYNSDSASVGRASALSRSSDNAADASSVLGKTTAYQGNQRNLDVKRSPSSQANIRRMLNESPVLNSRSLKSLSTLKHQSGLARHPHSQMPILPRRSDQPLRISRQRLPSLRRRSSQTADNGDIDSILLDIHEQDVTDNTPVLKTKSSNHSVDHGGDDRPSTSATKTQKSFVPTNLPLHQRAFNPAAIHTPEADTVSNKSTQTVKSNRHSSSSTVSTNVEAHDVHHGGNLSAAQLKELSSLMAADAKPEKRSIVVRTPSSQNLFTTSISYEDTDKRSQKANVRLLDTVMYGSLFGKVMVMTNAGMSFGNIIPGILVLITSLMGGFAEHLGGDTVTTIAVSTSWFTELFFFWH